MRALYTAAWRGSRIFLGAGVWMAGNLFFYKLYQTYPLRFPPSMSFLMYYLPILPAAVAHLWTYYDLRARGSDRTVMTVVGLLAHAFFWAYFLVFAWLP